MSPPGPHGLWLSDAMYWMRSPGISVAVGMSPTRERNASSQLACPANEPGSVNTGCPPFLAKRRHQQHTRGLSPRHTRNIGHLTYCNGAAGQNWQINGECLDITGAGAANGTELQDSA
jgi:hypothetical protein